MAKQSAHERRIRAKLKDQEAVIERLQGEIEELQKRMFDKQEAVRSEVETVHLLEELLDAPNAGEGEREAE